ncbi:MAG TPA: SUMF1/EgtB/PvdO family nonheme iron enzyme [Noviherbaspirillum sp.]
MRSFIHIVFKIVLMTLALASASVPAARADTLPREVVINGVEFIHVPEGWFWYATGAGYWKDMQTPQSTFFRDTRTWLDGFYIAKFEARGRDLLRFLSSGESKFAHQYARGEADGCAVRRRPTGEYYLADPSRDLPATHMSWQLADEFARWMGFRLPTEAEWTKAARGTDRRIWPWGNEYPDDTFAGFGTDSKCHPMPVDAFLNGLSPYGAYNMAGNAMEFVADWFNEDFDASMKNGQHNPPPATHGTLGNGELPGPRRILKGGRWASNADFIHIYGRNLHPEDENFVCFGVRFAMDVATVRRHLSDGTATVPAGSGQ